MESPSSRRPPPHHLNLKERCFPDIARIIQYWQYLPIRAAGIATFAAAAAAVLACVIYLRCNYYIYCILYLDYNLNY